MLFRTPIKSIKRGEDGEDSLGNPRPGPEVVTVFYGEFRPLDATETVDRGTEIPISMYRVFLPAAAKDITAADRLEIMGQSWNVIGQPEPHNIGGRVHHYEALVRRIG